MKYSACWRSKKALVSTSDVTPLIPGQIGLLSRPLLRLLLVDIGFIYPVMSMVVIGPSLPILRQRRWSLLYDVFDLT